MSWTTYIVPVDGDTMPRDMGTPCYKCEKRELNCHSSCEVYRTWRADYDDKKIAITAKRQQERTADEYAQNLSYKRLRRIGKHK